MRSARSPIAAATVAAALTLAPSTTLAWGFEGHRIVAEIARSRLTPAVRARVDALLATDRDTLTDPDMASRATWADAWRDAGHRETAPWHYVDLELDGLDADAACFGRFRAIGSDTPTPTQASSGPANDCIVHKILEFSYELASPQTVREERLLALKYLMHLVADVHQPLHAADHHDRGGNCVRIALAGSRTQSLHSFWDTTVLAPLGFDPRRVAAALSARITPAEADAWRYGNAGAWATETYGVARRVAYALPSPAGCDGDAGPIIPPPGYLARAQAAAEVQLERAGVRLAVLLNRDLG